jgi:hypothetical protein
MNRIDRPQQAARIFQKIYEQLTVAWLAGYRAGSGGKEAA